MLDTLGFPRHQHLQCTNRKNKQAHSFGAAPRDPVRRSHFKPLRERMAKRGLLAHAAAFSLCGALLFSLARKGGAHFVIVMGRHDIL